MLLLLSLALPKKEETLLVFRLSKLKNLRLNQKTQAQWKAHNHEYMIVNIQIAKGNVKELANRKQ